MPAATQLVWDFSQNNKAEHVNWTPADGNDIKYFLNSDNILLTLPGRLPTVIYGWFAQAIMNDQGRIRMLRIMSKPGDAQHVLKVAESWALTWDIKNLQVFDQFRQTNGKSMTGSVIDTYDKNAKGNCILEIRPNIDFREPYYVVLVVGLQNFDSPDQYFAATQPAK